MNVIDISCYVPYDTPNMNQDVIILNDIVSGALPELSYNERSLYNEDVTTDNNWTFELGIESGSNVPT